MSEVTNALKRLERAGSENSKATLKLREAAKTIADEIITNIPYEFRGVELLRGYAVIDLHSNIGCFTTLQKLSAGYDSRGEVLNSGSMLGGQEICVHGDFNTTFIVATRETILEFAKDIADGLLDELADYMDEMAEISRKSTEEIQKNLKNRKDGA